MLKFKRGEIKINDVEIKGYIVEGLAPSIFRGLQIAVVKNGDRWSAYEATTGGSIPPSSWAGGLSNKTRVGILHIVANFLSKVPESDWVRMQGQLNYDLEKFHN